MRVLFLDIDGVLNNYDSPSHPETLRAIDPVNTAQLNAFCAARPDVELVLSSTWREYYSKEQVTAYMRAGGYTGRELFAVTPFRIGDPRGIGSGDRGVEIQEWLDAHPECTEYAIIDDSHVWTIPEKHPGRLVLTDDATGMTAEHVAKLLTKLPPTPT